MDAKERGLKNVDWMYPDQWTVFAEMVKVY